MSAQGSANRTRVTKSRSSALLCSAEPADCGWKPVMCERRLSGMRLMSHTDPLRIVEMTLHIECCNQSVGLRIKEPVYELGNLRWRQVHVSHSNSEHAQSRIYGKTTRATKGRLIGDQKDCMQPLLPA